ncbi:MAG: hypothetical protein AVO38_00265 [delta proteobacterium ML8_D]|jgi:N-acetylglucosamine-6-phosphate deacetylase|nr:MAG: hypothetical protein AVO38_00265 [delta proteobacterium ML8_D]
MDSNKKSIILTGTLITPFELVKDRAVVIEDGKIVSVEDKKNIAGTSNSEVINVTDGFIVPGFIDIHVHGGGGFDTMDGNYDAIKEISRAHSRFGTTAFLPTTMTMSKDRILKSLKSVNEAFVRGTGYSEVLGANVEGPYINPIRKGAQKEEDIRNASIDEFIEFNEASGNIIRITTVAPEMPGALDLIQWLHKHGIIISIGHSNATYEQAREGVKAGISHVTHIFNAMTGFAHREPGIVGAALFSPEIIVEMISDGIHLHPLAMKMVTKVKEMEKIILITDAMRAAGMPDGSYELGGQEVSVKNGEARLADGTLAGSILTPDRAVRNMVDIAGISLVDAIRMATINPARRLGVENRKGSLEPGKDADIVILNENFEVDETLVKGKVVYKSK